MLNILLATLFYFVVYCFFGWVLEGSFNFLIRGTFVKENFLIGPFKPMYGFAALFLIWAYMAFTFPFFLLSALIIPTSIEYVTAKLMLTYFNQTYWDYTHEPFNYHGIICMRFSLAWVILSGALVLLVHPFINVLYHALYPFWIFLSPLFVIYFIGDFVLSAKSKRITSPHL